MSDARTLTDPLDGFVRERERSLFERLELAQQEHEARATREQLLQHVAEQMPITFFVVQRDDHGTPLVVVAGGGPLTDAPAGYVPARMLRRPLADYAPEGSPQWEAWMRALDGKSSALVLRTSGRTYLCRWRPYYIKHTRCGALCSVEALDDLDALPVVTWDDESREGAGDAG